MNEMYAHFDAWKDIDRFYFIPLKLDLTYSIDSHRICMADDPLYLGSFIRSTLAHPDLFTFSSPRCNHQLFPYSYNGSPLSGRVDLEAICPECGWDDFVTVSGWHQRSKALRGTQKADRARLLKARLFHPDFKAATVEELLDWLRA